MEEINHCSKYSSYTVLIEDTVNNETNAVNGVEDKCDLIITIFLLSFSKQNLDQETVMLDNHD